ncbi:MAG: phosphatidate cytidylyltransferase [Alicyclobacillus sp.]|nr:phosphatidate cytidylyltransferase [Alicyclobacillus sp.]
MLRQRVLTGALGVLVLLGVMIWGYLPWRAFVWLGSLIAMIEFNQMLGLRWRNVLALWSLAVVTVMQWWSFWHTGIAIELIVGCALVWPVATRNRVPIQQSATVLIGALYLGYGGASLAALRGLPRGLEWPSLFLVCIWATDTVAYFAGSWLKGPKLWPAISPAKTISGAVAGVIGAAIGAVIVGFIAVRWFDVGAYACVGAVISVAGQIGDLVESAYKRSAGVKDSGRLLPGHGGMLDRVDSLMFAAPFAYALITVGASTWFR